MRRDAARRHDASDRWSRWRRARSIAGWSAVLAILSVLASPTALGQQQDVVGARDRRPEPVDGVRPRFTSHADSLDWESARALAFASRGFRLVVSLFDRQMWAIIGSDTVLAARVSVASGSRLEYQGRRWSFTTPRGRRTLVAKEALPVWVPPEWHYYEVARARGLIVKPLFAGRSVVLDDGRRLEIRSDVVDVVDRDSVFAPLDADEEIIFDGSLYMPPLGTRNRRIVGVLGAYRLDLADGYLLHGTLDGDSIGDAATHGCIRLRVEDLEWLYEFVPVGTRVYIY